VKLCRFKTGDDHVRIGLTADDSTLMDLTPAGIASTQPLLESGNAVARLQQIARRDLPRVSLSEVQLLAPVERQEVWAAGVTYLRSRTARMEESQFSANAYDRVYDAVRPELFFKSLPDKVVGPGEPVGIRGDAKWSVPEPELALVLDSQGSIVGYTIGNDLSSRDLEGENLLYLPQAKVYRRACALGPWIELGATEADARAWTIRLKIQRAGRTAFAGETSAGQIKRRFMELAEYLFRCQEFPHGAVLLTGTGIVPPEAFTLEAADVIQIEITGIGLLQNAVVVV
jgi:2-dehydro-3-deoxy-D-arabinonate dehydratase